MKLGSVALRQKVDVYLCVAVESSEPEDEESLTSKWMMLTPKYRETVNKSSYDRKHGRETRF